MNRELLIEKTMLGASIKEFRREVQTSFNKVEKSLTTLKDQYGPFAAEHRALLDLYDDVLQVIDKHKKEGSITCLTFRQRNYYQ